MRPLSCFLKFALIHLTATAAAPSPESTFLGSSPTSTRHLFLKAVLKPVNGTRVKISITNTFPEQLSILHWNNHFQTNQNAAYGSFQVMLINGTGGYLKKGPEMAEFLFAQALPSHFVNISAGSTYTDVLDLNRLFVVPSAGDYKITLDVKSRATLVSAGKTLSQQLQTAGTKAEGLPSIEIKSDPVTMKLQQSSRSQRLSKRQGVGTCAAQTTAVQRAVTVGRQQSRALSLYASSIDDESLYAEYFNNDTQKMFVNTVYNGISRYGANNNFYGITEYCDPNGLDSRCTDDAGTVAYNQLGSGASSSIQFCQAWFNLPVALTCSFPNSTNEGILDQGGAYLHELTHSPNLVGTAPQQILDGNQANCYSWSCANGAATGNTGEASPWLIAINYEFYAYAARALSTESCAVNRTAVDNIQLEECGEACMK